MIDRVQTKGNVVRADMSAGPEETLPYRIELRRSGDDSAVERWRARSTPLWRGRSSRRRKASTPAAASRCRAAAG